MQKKEHYRGKLPHFQQPGQWYFITCSLVGVLPKGAMKKYSIDLEIAKNRIDQLGVGLSKSNKNLTHAKLEYHLALEKYRLEYDKILNHSKSPEISLLGENNKKVLKEALNFWEGKRLESHAWCIMSNHLHWVVSIFEKGENGKPVYLQDILHSVKLFSARRINQIENRKGQLWVHESFETTIRDDFHFVNAVKYTINNPVYAGLIKNWKDWNATYLSTDLKKYFS